MGLTSITPSRYWRRKITDYDRNGLGVQEVTSAIVSDFFEAPGTGGRTARRASKAGPILPDEVLAQLRKHQPDDPVLSNDNLIGWHLAGGLSFYFAAEGVPGPLGILAATDPERSAEIDESDLRTFDGMISRPMSVREFNATKATILSGGATEGRPIAWSLVNADPLFINTTGSAASRPPVDIGVANMFLAADYVRTTADLACMEGASEAARRAVNAVLRRARIDAVPCSLFAYDESPLFAVPQAIDDWAVASGFRRPWAETSSSGA